MAHIAPRSTHRPKRDDQKAQELADLKRQNNHLKRTVARLRKLVDHLELLSPEEEESMEVPTKSTPPAMGRRDPLKELPRNGTEPVGPICGECQSPDVLDLRTPGGKLIIHCRWCGWRS